MVVLSSDDEDDVKSSSRSRSKSVFSRSNPKGPKKPRPSGPRSRSCKQSSIVDEVSPCFDSLGVLSFCFFNCCPGLIFGFDRSSRGPLP